MQSFEPLHDQRQILLLTANVFTGVDDLAGLELVLPKALRPVPVDLSTHQLAVDPADRAVAGGARKSPASTPFTADKRCGYMTYYAKIERER